MNRRDQIRSQVRKSWPGAFAAGQVADYEEQAGDADQLNIDGATDALTNAEAEVGPRPQDVRAHWEVRALADQVFERILDTEGSGPGSGALEDRRARRADAVVDALVNTTHPGR